MPQHDLLMPRHVPKHQTPVIFPRATCRSMTPSCRGMPPQGRKVNVLHAAACLLHAATWPRILQKKKPHDLSLSFTLLNPIPSTQTLKFSPTFNPLTLANLIKSSPKSFTSLLNINHYSTYSCKIGRILWRIGNCGTLEETQTIRNSSKLLICCWFVVDNW